MEALSPTPLTSGTRSSDRYQAEKGPIDQTLSYNDGPRDSASPSYGSRRYIGIAALLPFAIVLLWSFGMGSSLLMWLLLQKIDPSTGELDGVFEGFIVVDEGGQTGSAQPLDDKSVLESNLKGMVILNTISLFSNFVVIPLMALGAFYVAERWLDDQANSKDGPTPLQFGLIMKMCSVGTLGSLFTTIKYLFINKTTDSTTRTQVSPVVYRALTITSIVVFLQYAVKATDLWVTADLGSAYYSKTSPVNITGSTLAPALGTRYNKRISPEDYGRSVIATDEHYIGLNYSSGDNYYYQGVDTMSDRSPTNHVAFVNISTSSSLYDTSSTAIIVRPLDRIPPYWSWIAPTIGLTARCQPAPCDTATAVYRCPTPSGGYPSMPVPSFRYMSLGGSKRTNYATVYDPTTGEDSSNKWLGLSPTGTNPTYAAIQLHLDNSGWNWRGDPSEIGATDVEGSTYMFYLGTCEITLHEIEVSCTGSSLASYRDKKHPDSHYKLASPLVPMSVDKATPLLTPLLTRYYDNYGTLLSWAVMQTLQSKVIEDTASPGFSKRVSEHLAKLSLAIISPMFELAEASKVADHVPKLVSRYPIIATSAFLAVVYAHGLFAIVLFVGIINKSSRSIVVDDAGWRLNWDGQLVRGEQMVPELQLVHSRLTDPLTVVAEHLSEPHSDDMEGSEKKRDVSSPEPPYTSAGALSARRRPADMFGVESTNTRRVEVGLLGDQEGGRRFGLGRKNARLG